MTNMTFAERCTLSEQCLPDAPYRAMLTKLHGEMLQEIERLYGKDIDTLLFEEHRLGFEKGSRSEREACYTIAKFNQSNHLEHLTADQIKARGETK